MKGKICMSIFLMLLVTSSLMSQQITERHRNGRIAKQYSFDKDGNYHGAYTEWFYMGKVVIKKNYSHGKLHGDYIEYFDNGQPHREIIYHKGTETSYKEWDYYDGKRYLKRSYTQTNDGKLLTAGMKMHYNDDWLETAGLLPNGRWSLAGYSKNAEYTERYNGNDTLYVWFDRTKEQFRGKGIDGKGYIYEWDKNGNLLKSPEKDLADKLEKARQDSIATANKLAEELRIKKEKERMMQIEQDSILKRQTDYRNLIRLVSITDSLYTEAITKYAKGDEQNLYKFLCKKIKVKKSKKNFDETLHLSIAKVLNIEPYSDMIDNYTFNAISGPDKTASIEYFPTKYVQYSDVGQYRINHWKYVNSFLNANKTINITDYQIKKCIIPRDIEYKFEMQKLLIEIMEYSNKNKMDIK